MSAETNSVLDHEYDGIKEYDNPLPGWWVALFWITVLYSGVYYFYYHVGVGPSIADEYDASILEFYSEQAKRFGDVEVTPGQIYTYTTAYDPENAQLMVGARKLYEARCSSCHRKDLGGNVGPNLTDDKWIHGGDWMDIYRTISEGVEEKGMPPWNKFFHPVQTMYLVAYIHDQAGSSPANPKDPEGKTFTRSVPEVIPEPVTPEAAPPGK